MNNADFPPLILGVYLSKHSDLLQINPFEVGNFGDIIIFKVMRVRSSIHTGSSVNDHILLVSISDTTDGY